MIPLAILVPILIILFLGGFGLRNNFLKRSWIPPILTKKIGNCCKSVNNFLCKKRCCVKNSGNAGNEQRSLILNSSGNGGSGGGNGSGSGSPQNPGNRSPNGLINERNDNNWRNDFNNNNINRNGDYRHHEEKDGFNENYNRNRGEYKEEYKYDNQLESDRRNDNDNGNGNKDGKDSHDPYAALIR